MASGRINSEQSLQAAKRMLEAYGGSWAEVERVATVDHDGVFVVRRPADWAATSHNRR